MKIQYQPSVFIAFSIVLKCIIMFAVNILLFNTPPYLLLAGKYRHIFFHTVHWDFFVIFLLRRYKPEHTRTSKYFVLITIFYIFFRPVRAFTSVFGLAQQLACRDFKRFL